MIRNIFEILISYYESFYLFLSATVGSYALATILLSVIASLLLIPPLRWANKITGKEKDLQQVIMPQIANIKLEGNGAQQHARINALYTRYSYHPIYSIRLIMGLFIQLPFLVLTFFMFEGLDVINGESFLVINDLGQPDGLLYANGNALPFLMTAINLIAALFIPKFTRKDLTQAIFVSLLFFVLLYNAKSVLLLFWTANNVILLLRNIMANKAVDISSGLNFQRSWLKLQLIMHRKEVALFFVIFFIYTQTLLFVFDKSYNLVLTKGFYLFTLLMLAGLFLVHLISFLNGIRAKIIRINSQRKLSFSKVKLADALVILIPLAPIFEYTLLNQELLSLEEQFLFILISISILSISIWLIPLILQRFLPVIGLLPLSLALACLYVSMPTFVVLSSWGENPDLTLLLVLFLVLLVVFWQLYDKHQRTFQFLSIIFFTISASFTGIKVFILIDSAEVNPYLNKITSIDFSNFVPRTPMKEKPDVYLLTYDSYVGQKTMEKYGIDNTKQENFLKHNGFKIYPKTYSVAYDSVASMSRVLEMTRDLTRSRRFSMAGNALVPAIFEKHGYKTHGVLAPSFLMEQIGYDYSFPSMPKNHSLGLNSIFEGLREGQFRFEMIDKSRRFIRSEWIDAKRKILSEQTDYPKFMYTHTGPGHSQNSGTCLANETQLFQQRLSDANNEMTLDIETVLASNREAIIIINGDHGPYLTGDCSKLNSLKSAEQVTQLHLQDRLGTFLAIRWPEKKYEKYDNIRTLQDTFEVVFKYLFDTDKVLHKRPSTSSIAKGNNLEDGAVVNGVILSGVDKGKPLFSQE